MGFPKGHPGYPPRADYPTRRKAARNLAMVCKEAATDEELAQWLLEIASGRWPEIRPKRNHIVETMMPPSEAIRFAALKEFITRRDGLPMQAVVLDAQVHMRARMLNAADDVIDVEAIDTAAANVLETALRGALAAGKPEEEPEE